MEDVLKDVIDILNHCRSKLGEITIEASDKNLNIVIGVKQLLTQTANSLTVIVEANQNAPQPEQTPTEVLQPEQKLTDDGSASCTEEAPVS